MPPARFYLERTRFIARKSDGFGRCICGRWGETAAQEVSFGGVRWGRSLRLTGTSSVGGQFNVLIRHVDYFRVPRNPGEIRNNGPFMLPCTSSRRPRHMEELRLVDTRDVVSF